MPRFGVCFKQCRELRDLAARLWFLICPLTQRFRHQTDLWQGRLIQVGYGDSGQRPQIEAKAAAFVVPHKHLFRNMFG